MATDRQPDGDPSPVSEVSKTDSDDGVSRISNIRKPLASIPEIVAGRCELFDEIGSGGMATVQLGRLIGAGGFDRTVAVKRMHPQFSKDVQFTQMFMDEARLAARIRHPNVLPTLDVIERNGELFIVMEYVEGANFNSLQKSAKERKQRVPLGVALRVVCGVLHGLHAAHEARGKDGKPLDLVHRDVSPDNILVGVDGYTRLLDFGVARALGNRHRTGEGQMKGKLAYMSPEQALGQPIDRRTDIYSASVVLWQAMTGRRLFDGKHIGEISHKVLNKSIDAPSYIVPDLPKKLDAIVLNGLQRDREDRYATAIEMADALEAVGDLATPRDVGTWVRTMAADRLKDLALKIEAIDRSDPLEVSSRHMFVDRSRETVRPSWRGEEASNDGTDPDAIETRVFDPSQPNAEQGSLDDIAMVPATSRQRQLAIIGALALGALIAAWVAGVFGDSDGGSAETVNAGEPPPPSTAATQPTSSPRPTETPSAATPSAETPSAETPTPTAAPSVQPSVEPKKPRTAPPPRRPKKPDSLYRRD